MSRPQFTDRQAKTWPEAVAEAQRYVDTSTISVHLHSWAVEWADETRPGRGHNFTAIWCDGEYLVQISMDVYGRTLVSAAETRWPHSSADEECECAPCTESRKDTP